jgi:hypothetical protein
MLRGLKTTIVIATAIFLNSSSIAENPVKPELNLVPGEKYKCTMEMSKRVKQTIEGEEQIMEQSLIIVWDYNILKKNDAGEYSISAEYSRIKSSQKFGMQTVEFDSDDPSEYIDPSMIGYKALVGMELKMDMTPRGKVERLSGFEEIIDKIIDDLKIPESPQRDEIIKGIRSQFGDEAMRQSFEQMTVFYPDRPVDIGDSWNSDFSMDVGFPMLVESDYTMLSRKGGIADIDVVSTVRSSPGSEGIDMGLFSLIYDIEGSQKGLIKLDESSGLPVRSDIEQSFSGTVSVSETDDLEERSWPISAEGRVVITFEKQ